MKHRSFQILLGLGMLVLSATLWAQQKGGQAKGKPAVAPKKATIYRPRVYLGQSEFAGGDITTQQFTSLMKQGLKSVDSTGKSLKVVDFMFSYAERSMFEDEQEQLKVMTEVSSEYCIGDTLSPIISSNIYERIKRGDTVYFEHIHLLRNGKNGQQDTVYGKGFKCVFVKPQ